MIEHLFRVTNRHGFDGKVFRGQSFRAHQSKEIGTQSRLAAELGLPQNT